MTYAVTSMGNPQWTQVGYDQTYTSWATGSTSSILGSLWSFSQSQGTASYYSTLTINLPIASTVPTALVLPGASWYAIPILKILSYTAG